MPERILVAPGLQVSLDPEIPEPPFSCPGVKISSVDACKWPRERETLAQGCFLSCLPVSTSTASTALTVKTAAAGSTDQVFEPANSLPSRSESAAVQPVIGIGQRVKMRPNEKKDLGTLGYVLGLIMVVIIISIGAGIVVGYVYKRGKDLKEQHEQKVYEREMQRITLPLSAFTNPACELVDENMIVVHSNQTPVEDVHEGDAPLMAQAGTPGA